MVFETSSDLRLKTFHPVTVSGSHEAKILSIFPDIILSGLHSLKNGWVCGCLRE